MKGVIVICLAQLVSEKFGKDKWEHALEKAGLDRNTTFLAGQDIDDNAVLEVVKGVSEVLGITLEQAADAFGDYWVNVYSQKIYGIHYEGINNAKEFLLKMDHVHKISTENIPGARPPRFEYEEKDENTLIMTYKSHRGLIAFMIGLIKGVGKFYKEDLKVTKLGDDKVEIVFPK